MSAPHSLRSVTAFGHSPGKPRRLQRPNTGFRAAHSDFIAFSMTTRGCPGNWSCNCQGSKTTPNSLSSTATPSLTRKSQADNSTGSIKSRSPTKAGFWTRSTRSSSSSPLPCYAGNRSSKNSADSTPGFDTPGITTSACASPSTTRSDACASRWFDAGFAQPICPPLPGTKSRRITCASGTRSIEPTPSNPFRAAILFASKRPRPISASPTTTSNSDAPVPRGGTCLPACVWTGIQGSCHDSWRSICFQH